MYFSLYGWMIHIAHYHMNGYSSNICPVQRDIQFAPIVSFVSLTSFIVTLASFTVTLVHSSQHNLGIARSVHPLGKFVAPEIFHIFIVVTSLLLVLVSLVTYDDTGMFNAHQFELRLRSWTSWLVVWFREWIRRSWSPVDSKEVPSWIIMCDLFELELLLGVKVSWGLEFAMKFILHCVERKFFGNMVTNR